MYLQKLARILYRAADEHGWVDPFAVEQILGIPKDGTGPAPTFTGTGPVPTFGSSGTVPVPQAAPYTGAGAPAAASASGGWDCSTLGEVHAFLTDLKIVL